MAADNLSQSRKRRIAPSDEVQAKKTKENGNSSSGSIDLENEQVAGKIKRMFLKNFMCHDAMEVEFNQKVNFIVGANGSGKSAILTALVVGLGGSAKAACRGAAAKEFVKKGKNTGSVEIVLTNQGPMAYKNEVYGDSITVIRKLGSASSYTIKNWRGEIVSSKKEELTKIVNFLNIQVDNPISVLNQDVSRSFLITAGPKEKYDLMMRATRLNDISANYKQAMIASDDSRGKLKDAMVYLIDEEKEIKKLEKKVKALESLDKVRREYESLRNELPWAAVIGEEKKLLQIDAKVKEQEKRIEDLKNLEATKANKEKEIDSKIENLKKDISEAEAESVDSNSKLAEIKNKLSEVKKLHEAKKEKVRTLHQYIKNKEKDIMELQNAIREMEKEQAGANKKEEAKEELTKCENELDAVEATYRTKQTDLMHLEENRRRIEGEEKNIRIEMEQRKKSLNQNKQRYNALQSQPNDAVSVYGQNMPRLLKRIEEEFRREKFRKKPVGPIGAYIKVKDSSWIPAVENQLGFGFLQSFCVDNSNDNKVLSIIIKEVCRGDRAPNVIISRFFDKVHDVRDGCTKSSRYSNLFDAMEIDHPVVANCIIDQKEIECLLLIPTSSEACTVMDDYRKVPRNCKRAITKNADLFFPDPHYKTYGGSVSKPKFLQVSTNEAMQSLQEEITVIENELQLIQQRYKEVHDKMGKNKSELYQVQDLVKRLSTQQRQLKNRIEELKEIIETCNDNTINTFMTEMEELKKQVADKKAEESVQMEDFRSSQKNVDAITAEYKTCRDLAQNLDAKLNPIKEKIKDLKDEKNRLNVSNKGAIRRMEEAKQSLQKLTGEHQQQQRVVNNKIASAEETCPRVDTRKSVVDITSKMKELKLTIENVEKQHGSKEVLSAELETKKAKFLELQQNTVRLQKNNDKQIERLKKRKAFFNQMKREIGERIQQAFVNVLKLRNYKGKIVIDHSTKELLLEVTPAASVGKTSSSDAKSLSGGERSYSTVAFILALWETVGLPFYFLDEFDVFMDKINRRIIMDILMNHALTHPECQFGFLTPLDTSHIMADNSITIHRLAAPERAT